MKGMGPRESRLARTTIGDRGNNHAPRTQTGRIRRGKYCESLVDDHQISIRVRLTEEPHDCDTNPRLIVVYVV